VPRPSAHAKRVWCAEQQFLSHRAVIDKGSKLKWEEETTPKKRLRLVKEYLVQLEEEGGSCHANLLLSYWKNFCPMFR